jgi:hypothetical protein
MYLNVSFVLCSHQSRQLVDVQGSANDELRTTDDGANSATRQSINMSNQHEVVCAYHIRKAETSLYSLCVTHVYSILHVEVIPRIPNSKKTSEFSLQMISSLVCSKLIFTVFLRHFQSAITSGNARLSG